MISSRGRSRFLKEPGDPSAEVVLPDLEHTPYRREGIRGPKGPASHPEVIEVPAARLDGLPPSIAPGVGRAPARLVRAGVGVRYLPLVRSLAFGVNDADSRIFGAGADGARASVDVDDRRRREAVEVLRVRVDPEAGTQRIEPEPLQTLAVRALPGSSRGWSSCHAITWRRCRQARI